MTRPRIPIAALTPTVVDSLPDDEIDAAVGKLADAALAAAHQNPAAALALMLAAISECSAFPTRWSVISPIAAVAFMAGLCAISGAPRTCVGGCYWLTRLESNVTTLTAGGTPLSGAWS